MQPSSLSAPPKPELSDSYRRVRAATERLCEPLHVEDYVVQSMPDVSPTKWHLAHTSWFFETFVLKDEVPGYRPFHNDFEYLFNSYYNAVGEQHPRPERGLLTRPTVQQVFAYRAHVDESMCDLLERNGELARALAERIELGLHHEQQHQELMLMDLKHVLFRNPLYPSYRRGGLENAAGGQASGLRWIELDAGTVEIGHQGDGFCYDNERTRHRVVVERARLASRLVTNEEYRAFIEDGGYRRPEFWLADGWTTVCREGWRAPLYWVERDGRWHEFTLAGLTPLCGSAPVCHLSYYEADAYAAWAGARLPSEAEWETVAAGLPVNGNFVEDGRLHPGPAPVSDDPAAPAQFFGDVWEWTRSAYAPYPGFRAAEGAIGEYNGKFMCNQYVLRGGACVTPRSHLRATYRNFFYPHQRWQFAGLRLAQDS